MTETATDSETLALITELTELNRGAFERLETKIDQRFEQVDQRFEQVDQRFDRLETEVAELRSEMGERFDRLESLLKAD